jgi:hypothetical protein
MFAMMTSRTQIGEQPFFHNRFDASISPLSERIWPTLTNIVHASDLLSRSLLKNAN